MEKGEELLSAYGLKWEKRGYSTMLGSVDESLIKKLIKAKGKNKANKKRKLEIQIMCELFHYNGKLKIENKENFIKHKEESYWIQNTPGRMLCDISFSLDPSSINSKSGNAQILNPKYEKGVTMRNYFDTDLERVTFYKKLAPSVSYEPQEMIDMEQIDEKSREHIKTKIIKWVDDLESEIEKMDLYYKIKDEIIKVLIEEYEKINKPKTNIRTIIGKEVQWLKSIAKVE